MHIPLTVRDGQLYTIKGASVYRSGLLLGTASQPLKYGWKLGSGFLFDKNQYWTGHSFEEHPSEPYVLDWQGQLVSCPKTFIKRVQRRRQSLWLKGQVFSIHNKTLYLGATKKRFPSTLTWFAGQDDHLFIMYRVPLFYELAGLRHYSTVLQKTTLTGEPVGEPLDLKCYPQQVFHVWKGSELYLALCHLDEWPVIVLISVATTTMTATRYPTVFSKYEDGPEDPEFPPTRLFLDHDQVYLAIGAELFPVV